MNVSEIADVHGGCVVKARDAGTPIRAAEEIMSLIFEGFDLLQVTLNHLGDTFASRVLCDAGRL